MVSLWTIALICCVIFASQASAGNYILNFGCETETKCSKILNTIKANLPSQLAISTNVTNNVTILDLNECKRINPVCSKDATCTNKFRLYECKCNAGFFDDNPAKPGVNCTDVDECSNSTLNNCSLDATCQNTAGGFGCTCNTGFADLTFSNGTDCTDINECDNPLLHKCSINATCVNMPGNYSCACAVGFQDYDPTEPGTNCTDINECNNTDSCPSNSNCTNTQGSYLCTCNPGYTILADAADSEACFDVDECSNSGLNNCTASQMCVNTEGTYNCTDVTTTQVQPTTAVTTVTTVVTTASTAVTTPSKLTTVASIAATTAQQTTAETTTSPTTSPVVTSEIGTPAFESTTDWVTNLTLISNNVTSSNTAPLLTTNSIPTNNPLTSATTLSAPSVVTNASMTSSTTEAATKYTSTPSSTLTDTVTSDVTTDDVTTPTVLPIDVTSLPQTTGAETSSADTDLTTSAVTTPNIPQVSTQPDTTPTTHTTASATASTTDSTVLTTTGTTTAVSITTTTANKATTNANTTASTTAGITPTSTSTAVNVATTNANTTISNALTTVSTASVTTQATDTSTNTSSKATTSEATTSEATTTQLTLVTSQKTATTTAAITTSSSTTSSSTTSSSTTSSSTTSSSTTSSSTTSSSTTSPSTTSSSTTATQNATTRLPPTTNAATTSTTQSPDLPPSLTGNVTAENIENGSKLYSVEAVTYIQSMQENITSGEAMTIVTNLEKLVIPGGGIPVNENVATSVLEVIDAFGASTGVFGSNVTSSLTNLTDTLLSNMQLAEGSFELNLPTVSVGAKDITGTQTNPIAFSLGSGFNTSTGDSSANIQLPAEALGQANTTQVRVSFSAFTNARLFPSPGVTTVTNSNFSFEGTTGSVVNSAVMGSTVANTLVRDLKNLVKITVPAIVGSIPTVERSNGTRVLRSVYNPQCSFFDHSMNGGRGGWSKEGCVTVTPSKGNDVSCQCGHLTSFAVLMSVEESSHDDVLHIMTFVGCALSITGLVITIVTYTLFRQFRTHKSKRILVHFCFSLFGVSITYLLGIATHLPSNQEQCIASGFFMHFFTTSTFAWMFIEVFDMYLMFVKVMNVGRHHYVRKACLFGWGFPALLAICTLGAHFALVGNYPGQEEMRMYPTYRSTVACWLNQRALLWALILPMGLLMFVNIVLFSFVLYHVTCKRANTMQQSGTNNMRRNSLKEVKASHHVINATAIILLTGPTWIIGFLINIDPIEDGVLRRILSYIFVIFNAFQGLWVFLIFTVRPKSVRQRWRSLLCEKGGLQSVSRASVSWGKRGSRHTGSVSTTRSQKHNVSFDQRRISALSAQTGVTLVRHSVDHGQAPGKSPRQQPGSQRSSDQSPTLPSSDKSPAVSYRYSRGTSKVDHDVTTPDVTKPKVVTEDVYASVSKKKKVSTEDKELSRSNSDVTRTNIDLETGSDVGLVQSDEGGDFEAARN